MSISNNSSYSTCIKSFSMEMEIWPLSPVDPELLPDTCLLDQDWGRGGKEGLRRPAASVLCWDSVPYHLTTAETPGPRTVSNHVGPKHLCNRESKINI